MENNKWPFLRAVMIVFVSCAALLVGFAAFLGLLRSMQVLIKPSEIAHSWSEAAVLVTSGFDITRALLSVDAPTSSDFENDSLRWPIESRLNDPVREACALEPSLPCLRFCGPHPGI